MSEKVKLPRKVAESIERFRAIDCDNASIIYTFASGEDKNNSDFADFAADNFDTLLKALVNGYEVEETPEERLKDYYNKMIRLGNHGAYSAVLDVLRILNKKIDGVNA